MKLIYATGFSKNEKLEWKPVVFNNIVQSFRLIYDAMTELGIAFEQPESEVRLRGTPTPTLHPRSTTGGDIFLSTARRKCSIEVD